MSAGVAAFASPLHAFQARIAAGRSIMGAGYGPLIPATDMTTGLKLLELPPGFKYMTLGWAGDPMSNAVPTPARHDGMAAFQAKGNLIALVRKYAPGATVAVEFRRGASRETASVVLAADAK